MEKKKEYLPIPVPQILNCDAFIPRPLFATSPKSHPSPYLDKRGQKGIFSQNHATIQVS